MPIQVASFLEPKNGNSFFLVEDKYFKGGLQVVGDAIDRDNIPLGNRKPGMMVVTAADNKLWQLNANNITWDELKFDDVTGFKYTPDRTSIPAIDRVPGMLVVQSDGTSWRLDSDLVTWHDYFPSQHLQIQPTLADLVALPTAVKKAGMMGVAQDTKDIYQLQDDLLTWSKILPVDSAQETVIVRTNLAGLQAFAGTRISGMLGIAQDTGIIYQLQTNLTTWTPVQTAGGGGTGGVVIVADTPDLFSFTEIPPAERTSGMLAIVNSTKLIWQLEDDLLTWIDVRTRQFLKIVPNAAARDAIPTYERVGGMLAVTQNDSKLWQLLPDMVSWVDLFGGGTVKKPLVIVADIVALQALTFADVEDGALGITRLDYKIYQFRAGIWIELFSGGAVTLPKPVVIQVGTQADLTSVPVADRLPFMLAITADNGTFYQLEADLTTWVLWYAPVDPITKGIIIVPDVPARDALPILDLLTGTLVITQDTNTLWQLRIDRSGWDDLLGTTAQNVLIVNDDADLISIVSPTVGLLAVTKDLGKIWQWGPSLAWRLIVDPTKKDAVAIVLTFADLATLPDLYFGLVGVTRDTGQVYQLQADLTTWVNLLEQASPIKFAVDDTVLPVASTVTDGAFVVTQDDYQLFQNQNGVYQERFLPEKKVLFPTRTNASHVTATLALDAVEDFDLDMGFSSMVYTVTVDKPCKVEAFATPTRDESNPYTFIATETHLSDDGSTILPSSEIVKGRRYSFLANLEEPRGTNIFWRITNSGTEVTPINISITYLPLEVY